MVQSNSWLPIAAASMPKALNAATTGRPNAKLETGVPCISSPASTRTTVQPQSPARLSSQVFSAADPPTGRPSDQGQTCADSAPWKSVIASTLSNVLSVCGTGGGGGANTAWTAESAGGAIDQLGVKKAEARSVSVARIALASRSATFSPRSYTSGDPRNMR